MSEPDTRFNRVRQHRLALQLSQAELAGLAGISRTGLSAIEGQRLDPSVATAMALAHALQTSVEDLFGEAVARNQPVWANEPTRYPSRFWSAEVAGRTVLFPVENSGGLAIRQDGFASQQKTTIRISRHIAQSTLVIATCDPAANYLALEYERQSPFRMIVLRRPSREALTMMERGLIHVAGIHLADSQMDGGNQAAIEADIVADVHLLAVASWEEGVAHPSSVKLRSAKQAGRTRLRWIGRLPGAGARRCQDDVLGHQRSPRHIARDHHEVVASIRTGFVDAGVCVRLVAEEAHLGFLPVREEDYDLCFPEVYANDPRITALKNVVRSSTYRDTLADLPGYRLRRGGAIVVVKRQAHV